MVEKTEIHNFSLKELNIGVADVVSLMGYGDDSPPEITNTIERTLLEFENVQDIKGGFMVYDAELISDDFKIRINDQEFYVGKSIWHYYKHSTKMAVFTCTAGKSLSDYAKKLMDEGLLIEGYSVDVLGNVIVERAMDKLQEIIKEYSVKNGLKITNRYSPGYCAWDVAEQHKLFALLPNMFCGVQINSSALMMPAKSVSGFIGLGNDVKFREYSCKQCTSFNCVYRNKK